MIGYPFPAEQSEILIRLSMAVLLGLLVGAERTHVGKRAGMRTYALVSLGSALFTVVSGMVASAYQNIYDFDPLRVASQIVVGVGFLGAGVIYVQRSSITGLTTAAGLWVVSAVGMACGFGFYTIAVFVTFIMLVVFELLWYVEDKFVRKGEEQQRESS